MVCYNYWSVLNKVLRVPQLPLQAKEEVQHRAKDIWNEPATIQSVTKCLECEETKLHCVVHIPRSEHGNRDEENGMHHDHSNIEDVAAEISAARLSFIGDDQHHHEDEKYIPRK